MKNLEALKYVSENSNYVFIDKEKINLTEEEAIIFAFICESINFCFWGNRKWKDSLTNYFL